MFQLHESYIIRLHVSKIYFYIFLKLYITEMYFYIFLKLHIT